MISSTDYGVSAIARRMWSFHAIAATPRPSHAKFSAHAAGVGAAMAAQRKRRANAAPTIASVDRSFI
jgi:hypothetical protein